MIWSHYRDDPRREVSLNDSQQEEGSLMMRSEYCFNGKMDAFFPNGQESSGDYKMPSKVTYFQLKTSWKGKTGNYNRTMRRFIPPTLQELGLSRIK